MERKKHGLVALGLQEMKIYILRTFGPIATAHLQCARYSLGTRVPRRFQARAPSRKLDKI